MPKNRNILKNLFSLGRFFAYRSIIDILRKTMEKKKNIIHIYGKDLYGCELERDRLRDAFAEKYDVSNTESIRIEEVKDWGHVEQDILTVWLFAEKRLFLISGWYVWVKKSEEEWKETKKEKKNTIAEDALIRICEQISDEQVIIFSSLVFAPRSKLRDWLMMYASERKYDILWDTTLWRKRFPEIAESIIVQVLGTYKNVESTQEEIREGLSHAIGETFLKISYLDDPSENDIESSIMLEAWGKVFDFTDAIMRDQPEKALIIFHMLIETLSIYALIGSLIGLLRWSVYTKYLQFEGKNMRQIGQIITAHQFVIQKSYESRISYPKLRDFYDALIASNISSRSGKWFSNPELWHIFFIERAIMGLKK